MGNLPASSEEVSAMASSYFCRIISTKNYVFHLRLPGRGKVDSILLYVGKFKEKVVSHTMQQCGKKGYELYQGYTMETKSLNIDLLLFTEQRLEQLAVVADKVNSLSEDKKEKVIYGSEEEYLFVLLPLLDSLNFFDEQPANQGKLVQHYEYEKTMGNSAFTCHELDYALARYHKAILYASTTSDLAVCYGNISAVLFELKNYISCLEAIREAIKHGFPSAKLGKLQSRLLKCCKELMIEVPGNMSLSADASAVQQILSKVIEELKASKSIPIPSFAMKYVAKEDFPRNLEMPAVSSDVSLNLTELKGYHMIANEDIYPGDMILIEDPALIIQNLDSPVDFCHHCCARLQVVYPCQNCANVIFCSPQCKANAEPVHARECNLLASLRSDELNVEPYWALRLISRVAPQQFLDETLELLGKKNGDSYYSKICELESHPEWDNGGLKIYFAAVVWFMTKRLAIYFEGCKTVVKSPIENVSDVLFHAGVVLAKLLTSVRYNRIAVNEMPFGDFGSAVYMTFSRINHSCDVNTVTYNYGRKIIVVASRGITKGAEININYGVHVLLDTFEKRQDYLKKNYWFKCECTCCADPPSWLKDRGVEKVEITDSFGFCCPKCRSFVSWSADIDPDGVYLCSECKAKLPLMALLERFQKANEDLKRFPQTSLITEESEFNKLRSIILELDCLLGSPSPTGIRAEDALRYCIESYAAVVMNDGVWL